MISQRWLKLHENVKKWNLLCTEPYYRQVSMICIKNKLMIYVRTVSPWTMELAYVRTYSPEPRDKGYVLQEYSKDKMFSKWDSNSYLNILLILMSQAPPQDAPSWIRQNYHDIFMRAIYSGASLISLDYGGLALSFVLNLMVLTCLVTILFLHTKNWNINYHPRK